MSSLTVRLCLAVLLPWAGLVPLGVWAPAPSLASIQPTFICRFWPSAPGCRW